MWGANYNDGKVNLTIYLEQKLKPREVFTRFERDGWHQPWSKKYLNWKAIKPGKVYMSQPCQPMLHYNTPLSKEATEKLRGFAISEGAINWTLERINRSADYEVHP